jgi:hypothetical protein
MAPLPPDSTARVKVFYETCNEQHTVQIRFDAPNTVDDVIASFNDWVGAIGPAFYLSSFVQAQVAVSGSNVFNDVAGDWPVTWGADAGPHTATANYVDFIGRSLDGRRVRAALFGCKTTTSNDDYRTLTTESTAVDDAIQVLNDAEGVWLSINGFQPIWKSYVNLGPTAYWRNKIRG